MCHNFLSMIYFMFFVVMFFFHYIRFSGFLEKIFLSQIMYVYPPFFASEKLISETRILALITHISKSYHVKYSVMNYIFYHDDQLADFIIPFCISSPLSLSLCYLYFFFVNDELGLFNLLS